LFHDGDAGGVLIGPHPGGGATEESQGGAGGAAGAEGGRESSPPGAGHQGMPLLHLLSAECLMPRALALASMRLVVV
jgi:hypothetical protein